MLARMNFAAALAANQRVTLARDAAGANASPEGLLDHFLDRLSPALYSNDARSDLLAYLEAGGAWSGSDAQLRTKAAGLVHLIVGSGEYQLV
jgi:hypothetical protein